MRTQEDQWLENLYRHTLPRVAAMVYRMGGHLEMAKDVFQDAVIIYLEKQQAQKLPPGVSAEAYITGIARILCIRQLKKSGPELSLDEMTENIGVPSDYYAPPPVARPVLDYIRSAGKRCLQLLQAFYYDQHSLSDIAAGFNFKTLHSASVQKYKCLEKVREQLKQSDYAETLS
ncbi:RNA polymerase sigma factor [Chitinophaga arvensicola]|uniref:DNA-directed RNA polymerase specialized sigma subunit, sigma24 family n=1 Tax=Chitinophaga arvensicola TaxID=29529 RepID=A0A1I0S6T4_9BACT|nr:sigma-70 family RNA polymerase sigma factor [Chitinophaga arvensicola]SEW51154.1 DNA-directed RNA polymerase specialized sigma subunit, sigma24 family [Chitinophaga arvensicola]